MSCTGECLEAAKGLPGRYASNPTRQLVLTALYSRLAAVLERKQIQTLPFAL